jgi:tetratricopeptide (TPR) repeat protein
MKNRFTFLWGFTLFLFFISLAAVAQQNLVLPDVSQQATVFQKVGLTDITINYHRPGVKDRQVWGVLVPYNEVWRAGANENTTISFSNSVMINGKEVPAGTYGLHMIPTESDWTIILNKDHRAWGSFFYDEKKDQLRFSAKPETAEHQEWLLYSFDDITENSTTIALRWEKLRVPFKIDIDVHKQVLADIEQQLTSLPGFGWQGWNQAANYCYANNLGTDKALTFADRSIQMNKNVTNSYTKALILKKMGKDDESEKLKEEAFANAAENDVNALGYQLLFAGKVDDALEVFKMNTEMYPESWNVWDSLGEGYMNKGETEMAVQNYTKALGMAPENQHKRIKGVLAQLEMK